MPHPAGFPPILAIAAVLFCAALLAAFYQALFPRPARWLLIAAAFVLGMGVTAGYVYFLPPAEERLVGIDDAWSALRAMVLVAGVPEEAVKLAATLIALALFSRRLTPAEAFQASLVAALGFAALENLQYARAFPEAAVPIAFGRGIVASFVHSMMAMIQGTFLAAFVRRGGWRRWDLVVLGYLAAVLAHALVDWGLVRLLLEYARNNEIRPETLMEALPIIIPCFLVVVSTAVTLFVRQLKICGAEHDAAARAAVFDDAAAQTFERHLALRRRWRKTGNVIVIAGIVGLIGSIVAAVLVSPATPGQPQPTALSQITPEELHASIVMTVILVFSPMLILCGILVRQKQ